MAFGLLTKHHLLGVSDELADRVRVTFDDVSVKNIKLLVFAFKNSGNKAIKKDDFEYPMKVFLGDDAKLLSFDIIKKYPDNLKIDIYPEQEELRICPALLNSGDYFLVQVLASVDSPSVKLDARIIDVSNLAPLTVKQRQNTNILAGFMGGSMFIGLATMGWLNPETVSLGEKYKSTFFFIIALMGVVILLEPFWNRYSRPSRRQIDFF